MRYKYLATIKDYWMPALLFVGIAVFLIYSIYDLNLLSEPISEAPISIIEPDIEFEPINTLQAKKMRNPFAFAADQ